MRTIPTTVAVALLGAGSVLVAAAPPAAAAPAAPAAPAPAVVTVSPTTVLDTATGRGLAHAGRLAAGQRVSPSVAGGPVPSSGVASVLVRLTASPTRAPGAVDGSSMGAAAALPAHALLAFAAGRASSATVELPVDRSDRIALTVTAATGLRADVVGYRRGTAAAVAAGSREVPAAALAAVTAAAPATTAMTAAVTGPSISGTVQTATRTRLVGVRVLAYDGRPRVGVGLPTPAPVATATTASNGAYTLTGLAAGAPHRYVLCFDGSRAGTASAASPAYDAACTGLQPVLGATERRTVEPELLTAGVLYSGVVQDSSGTPVAGVPVTAAAVLPPVAPVVTDGSGRFAITLPASAYVELCADGAALTPTAARPYGLVPACTTTSAVGAGGAVPGLVLTLADAGEAIVTVRGHQGSTSGLVANAAVSATPGHVVLTDSAGRATLTGVPLGTSQLCVRGDLATGGPAAQGYVSSCPLDPFDPASGVTVSTSAGTPAKGAITLAPAGAIGGTVDGGGAPSTGGYVYVDTETPDYRAVALDASGGYLLTGLRPGQHQLCVDGDGVGATGYAGACSTITVKPGTTSPGGADLAPGGAVGGTISDDLGATIAFADVYAFDALGPHGTTADAHGHYVVSGLADGSVVQVCTALTPLAGTSRTGYVDACLGSDPSGAPAKVTVHAGQTQTLDGTLVRGGVITGTVVDQKTGGGLSPVYVSTSGPQYGYTSTDSAGAYRIVGLAAGSYQVCSSGGGSVGPWAFGYLDRCTTKAVTVSTAGTARAARLALPRAGAITGHVTGPDGAAVVDAAVTVNGNGYGYTTTDASGGYLVTGLAPGRYQVCVDPGDADGLPPTGLQARCTPKPLPAVTAGAASATVVDQQLALGAAVGGVVTDATSGDPIADVSLDVPIPGQNGSPQTQSDASGAYAVRGLPADADLLLCAFPNGPMPGSPAGYVQVCVDVQTGDAGTTGRLDLPLQRGAGVKGTVRDGAGHVLSSVEVDVDDGAGDASSAYTDISGRYAITGFPPQDAKVSVCFAGASATDGTTTGYGDVCKKATATGGVFTVVNAVLPPAS